MRDGATKATATPWRCLLTWLALVLCSTASAQPALELPARADNAPLSPYLTYHHDTALADSADDAWRKVAEGRFEPLPGGKDAFGFQTGAFWFHATIVNRNPGETRWLLVQEYSLSDRLDLYLRYRDGRVVHHAGGDHLPFDMRSVRYRHPNVLVDLPTGEPVQVLLRVESESSMQVPLHLYTQTAFSEVSRDAQLAIGLYYGILLALFFYNLVLWISLRDASYFWYLCHITAFGLVLFTLNGLGFEYLWPDSPWLADHMVPISICLALIAMLQFARTFLELPQRAPRMNIVAIGLIAFFTCFGVASVWMPYHLSTPIASRAVLIGVIWIVFTTIHVLRRGYTPASLLLLAWSMFLLGTAIFTLLAFGALPKNFATEYGVQIGSALEMLLLSIALGYRYAQLRNENQRITTEANRELERNVALRTQELQQALAQLKDAHEKLQDSSRRDALTGLYNRSYFHEGFDRLLAECRDIRKPLSLLMVDLDHFKAINDHHGHLVGDDCLRWAARRIGQTLRPYEALLARFGGEEFVVVLPSHDLRAAVAVAEEVRQALVSVPCESQGIQVRISASIGVHTIAPDAIDDIDDALDTADKALYAAKANGRDCVRTSISAA